MPTGSFTISIDSRSYGLMARRVAPSPPGTGSSMPSSTYSGSPFDLNELGPWMLMEIPPSAVRFATTPGKRSMSSCSSGRPRASSMSSAVRIAWGIAAAYAGAGAWLALFELEWEQAATPRSRARNRWSWVMVISGESLGGRGRRRPFCLDDDDSVGTARTVQCCFGWLLEHLDRLDVVGIYPGEVSVGTGIDLDAVEHVQRDVASPQRRTTADAHGEPAVRCPQHLHAGETALQDLLDRLRSEEHTSE